MARILILGGGLAGMTAAERLTELEGEHQVTVVAPNGKFTFFPALVPMVFGDLKPEDIRFDLHEKLSRNGIRFIRGKAVEINPYYREVKLAGDDIKGSISYDYLLVAMGRQLATEKVHGFFQYAHHLLGIDAAINFRRAIEEFREGRIVVGMCPGAKLPLPVLETAFALSKKFQAEIAEGTVTIDAVFPTSLRGAFDGVTLFSGIADELKTSGINLVEDFSVTEVTGKEILTGEGRSLKHDLLMLVPPFEGQEKILSALGAADGSDFARVDPHLQIEGLKHHYAAGDITAFPGPKFGYLSVRQGEVAAENIMSEILVGYPLSIYLHDVAPLYKPKSKDLRFMHHGIWDSDLYYPTQGTILSWADNIRKRYSEINAASA